MTELKPCPFCGKQPYTDEDTAADFGQRRTGNEYAIACSWCEVSAPGAESMEQAITAWNTRAAPRTDGDDGELVERLRKFERWLYAMDLAGLSEEQPNLNLVADRITALSAEVERLRAVLQEKG